MPDQPAKKQWYSRPDVAHRYQDRLGRYANDIDQTVIAELFRGASGTLLDAPCGSGRFLTPLRDSGYQLTGADYSLAMLSRT